MAVRQLTKSNILDGVKFNKLNQFLVLVPVGFLVISGGGGGGQGVLNVVQGAGGNGIGYRTSTGGLGFRGATAEASLSIASGSTKTVTCGAGGAVNSGTGSNSVFDTITSTGSNTSGGNAGGNGAGATNDGFYGGAGLANTITGSSVTRCGGGGAGSQGSGGAAGGGNGNSTGTGGNATANTGSGGGGGSPQNGNSYNGGLGGSGLVILSYPQTYTITIGAGLTGTTALVGTNKVTTITAGTGTVSWA